MARLLLIGDIHLGRLPSRLPERLVAEQALGPAGALDAAVQLALARRPDGVLFAGDVVERISDRFAAWNSLAKAVERLLEAGIPVAGVTGNHDVEALPRLAERLPAFRLLGRGGAFEALDLPTRDGHGVRIWGWSFPSQHWSRDPLEGFQAARAAAPAFSGLEIGLLHGDLDQSISSYAPVKRSALEATGLDAWFLGHVHQPSLTAGKTSRAPIGYLGSLCGLDPGEPGRRGPWWFEAGADGERLLEHLPLAPVRYERLTIDVSPLAGTEPELAPLRDRLHGLLAGALDQALQRAQAEHPELACLLVRAELVGTSDAGREIDAALAGWRQRGELPEREHGRTLALFERLSNGIRPALDLQRLAASGGPLGDLARRLAELELDSPQAREWALGSGQALIGRLGPSYAHLDFERALPAPQRKAALVRAARAALEAAWAQIEGREEPGGEPR